MTSSSEGVVIRADQALRATPLATPDLTTGAWTRWAAPGVRGDSVTEDTLATLAERTRSAAEAQGFAVGWAKGVREASEASRRARLADEEVLAADEQRRRAEHAEAVSALRHAAQELHELAGTVCGRLEDQATELAWAVTVEVLGHRASQETAEDVVRRVLTVLPEGRVATVRLHPSVARSLAATELPTIVEVAGDPTMAPADALVELHDHVLDLRIDRALARVREVLA
jgi:flagellar assembly protein FliH